MSAETAEKEADRALELARREVKDAREEMKRLEIEAKEEARRAKIKAYHAKEVSKRGKALGRKLDFIINTVIWIMLITMSQATTSGNLRQHLAAITIRQILTGTLCDLQPGTFSNVSFYPVH